MPFPPPFKHPKSNSELMHCWVIMFIWVPNDIGGGCAALPNGFGPRLLPRAALPPAAGAAPPAASAASPGSIDPPPAGRAGLKQYPPSKRQFDIISIKKKSHNVRLSSFNRTCWFWKTIWSCAFGGSSGRDCMVVGQLPMQPVPITTKVYSIQHYVIKFVSDLRQVGGFLRVLWFSPPIHDIAEILLKVAFNATTLTICPKMKGWFWSKNKITEIEWKIANPSTFRFKMVYFLPTLIVSWNFYFHRKIDEIS